MSVEKFEYPPRQWTNLQQWLQKLAASLFGVMQGKTNNVREVTLAVDPATETVLTDGLITRNTHAFLSAMTANAAAVTGLWFEVTDDMEITVHHDATTDEDCTFAVVLHG